MLKDAYPLQNNSESPVSQDLTEIGARLSELVFGLIKQSDDKNNFQKDLEFKNQSLEKRLLYEKECNEKEISILSEIAALKNNQYYTETIQNIEDGILRDEFRRFCDTVWNPKFEVGPDTILRRIKQAASHNGQYLAPILIVGWSSVFSSPYFNSSPQENYLNFCEDISERLSLDDSFDLSMLSMFKEQSHSSISDALICHFFMQGLPTIMFYPEITDNKYQLDVIYWNQLRGHVNICQNTLYQVSINQSTDDYNMEIRQLIKDSIVAFSAFAADLFKFVTLHIEPSRTPDALDKIYNQNLVSCVRTKFLNLLSLIENK